ncbi:MAG: hypothetical protein HZA53_17960 [Planctomycetes bacterium]|nr:hypothetical protein [Planctomycetota bacterium]
MRRVLPIAPFALALAAPLASAQRFQRVFGSAADERATDARLLPGGGFAVAGAQAGASLLVVLGADGTPLLARAVQGGADARVVGETSGFVLGAEASTVGVANGLTWTRLDLAGAVVVSSSYPATAYPGDGRPPGFVAASFGFVLAGQRVLAPSIAQAPELVYLDLAGNVLGIRYYQDVRFAADAFGEFAGVRMLGAESFVAGSTGALGHPETRDTLVARLASDGSPVWARTFGAALVEDHATALVLAANGELLVAGNAASSAFVLRLTVAGDPVWRVELPGFLAADSIVERANGDVALAGTSAGHAALADLESTGALRWARAYPAGSSGQGACVLALQDGGLFLAGTADAGAGSGFDCLVVRTDPLGRAGCAEFDLPLAALFAPEAPVAVPLFAINDLGQSAIATESVTHDLVHDSACALEFVRSACAGDGTLATDCPCANRGLPGHGCANSIEPDGALLGWSGTPQPDALVLAASGVPSSTAPSVIVFQGDAFEADGVVFGDGVRCAGGTLVRLGVVAAPGGLATYPSAGSPSVSARGGVAPGSGELRWYQAYYRNAAASFCPPATFNVTNALQVVW